MSETEHGYPNTELTSISSLFCIHYQGYKSELYHRKGGNEIFKGDISIESRGKNSSAI